MIKKTRKKKEKSSLEIKVISFLFSSFLVFLIILLIVSNIKIHQRRIYLKSQMEEKEIEIERLMTNLQKLKEAGSIEEDYFIERIAREQLLLKKEGEEVVFFSFPEETENEKKKEDIPKREIIWWNPLTWNFY